MEDKLGAVLNRVWGQAHEERRYTISAAEKYSGKGRRAEKVNGEPLTFPVTGYEKGAADARRQPGSKKSAH